MKFLCVLLSVLALSTAHHDDEVVEVIEEFQQFMKDPMTKLKTMIRENFLSEDGNYFKPEVNVMFTMLEPQFCPVESKDCSPADSWLFGCTCRKGFRALGEDCRRKPCELFRNFRDNGLDSLSGFVRSESYEEMYQIFTDFFVIPLSRALCECPTMVGASINCVKNYDGFLFQMPNMTLPINKADFDKLVTLTNWRAVRTVLHGLVKSRCGEKNRKDCVVELSNMYTKMGTFQDNTMKGENVCLSNIRLISEYEEFGETMASFNLKQSQELFLNKLVDAYLKLQKKAMCETSCAAEMRDNFYSCCTKHSFQALTSGAMRWGYNNLIRNLWSIMSEQRDVPNFNGAIAKYLSVYDLETFCGDETDVYREKNADCDAVEAD